MQQTGETSPFPDLRAPFIRTGFSSLSLALAQSDALAPPRNFDMYGY
jgi:hypothetical protein